MIRASASKTVNNYQMPVSRPAMARAVLLVSPMNRAAAFQRGYCQPGSAGFPHSDRAIDGRDGGGNLDAPALGGPTLNAGCRAAARHRLLNTMARIRLIRYRA